MKYFYDTEFVSTETGYDLISIGIVDEEMNGYYAVSSEFDYDRAEEDPFIRSNVLPHLPPESDWKPRSVIAYEVDQCLNRPGIPVDLWGWFSSWDHTCLSKLFPSFPSPLWLPDYTKDIRQLMDCLSPYPNPRELPILQATHSAIDDAILTKMTYDYLMSDKFSWKYDPYTGEKVA